MTGIGSQESRLILSNGTPGISQLRLTVNGMDFRVTGMQDGQERTLDIGAALRSGDANRIEVTSYGKPGGSATLLVTDPSGG